MCDFYDEPAMNHRGVMIDLARGIPTKERFIDDIILIAKAKFNILHLHLTDNGGSAIKLSSLKEEMYIKNAYEISEMKELVDLCDALCLEIIPEFDVPGHSNKLISNYQALACEPEFTEKCDWALCAGEEETYILVEKIINEGVLLIIF